MELPEGAPAPRLCHLIKWPDFDGYGFNLHSEKSKSNCQYVGKVDHSSPAQTAGLQEGDRIVEVNGVNISTENHRQVIMNAHHWVMFAVKIVRKERERERDLFTLCDNPIQTPVDFLQL